MNPLPDLPPGAEITVENDANGVTLSWSAYKSDGSRFAGAGFLTIWLCGWAAGWFFAARAVVLGQVNSFALVFVLVWLAFWTLAGVVVVLKLVEMFRAIRPEFVRLEADRIQYYPGRGPSEARSCADLPSGGVMPVCPSPPADAPKSAVRGFVVDRVNERQRLYFDLDNRRVEIGGCLYESERAWLFAVLQRWLGEPSPAPSWAHGARRDPPATPGQLSAAPNPIA